VDNWNHDEWVFQEWMKFKKAGRKLYVLDCGLGDHYMFLQAITPEPDAIIACCFPEIEALKKYERISIAKAKIMTDIVPYNVYVWAERNNWRGTLVDAFLALYNEIYPQ
jgi:hypothetical protein